MTAAADRTHVIMANGSALPPALSVILPSRSHVHHSGALYSWGYNIVGCLGDGTKVSRNAPVRVRLPERAVLAAASVASTCALLQGAQIWCWGGFFPLSPALVFNIGTHAGSVPRFMVAGANHFCVVTVARAECSMTDGAQCQAAADEAPSDNPHVTRARRNDDVVW